MKSSLRLFQLLICLSALVFFSCKGKGTQGDGNIVSLEVPIDIYNEIKVDGAVDIIYEAKPDEAGYLRIETDENIIPLVDIEVKKNKLSINTRENINPTNLVIYTNSPSLKYIENKGVSNIHLVGAVAGDEFTLDQRGVGYFKADNLVFTKAEFSLRGLGDVTLGGQIAKAKMEIAGNGNIEAWDLKVDELDCQITGNGNLNVYVEDKLSIEIKGNGNIVYKGNPQITKQSIKGLGTVMAK